MPIRVKIKKELSSSSKIQLQAAKLKFAQLFYKALIFNIKNNTFHFENKERTLAGKTSKIPMINSGEFLEAIVIEDGVVKMKEGKHSSGIDYTELSDLLEYGRRDKAFTGYPVWRLTYKQLKKHMDKEATQLLKTLLK